MTDSLFQIRHVSKRFGSTQALDDLSLELYPGEIHALIGENGTGKSTLIKIMTRIYQPDQGDVHIDGQPIHINNTQRAQTHGIAAIYQEPMIFPDLNVAENIFISHRDFGQAGHSDGYPPTRARIIQADVLMDNLETFIAAVKKYGVY